jgi:replicative DNA helicase
MNSGPLPPMATEAERALLGAVFLRGGEVLDRCELLAEDFYDMRHREIWRTMLAAQADGHPPGDYVELERRLGSKLDAVGGEKFLSSLINGVPTADNAEHYANLVRNASIRRRLYTDLGELRARIFEEDDADELIGAGYSILGKVSTRVTDGARPLDEVMKSTYMALSKAMDEGGTFGLQTNLTDLDFLMGGLRVGTTTILAGRPSQGKSALARTIADNLNVKGVGVHYFSQDDSDETLCIRLLSDRAKIDLGRLSSAKLIKSDMPSLLSASNEICARKHWLIDSTGGITSAQIVSRVRRHLRENQTQLVVVDYVQLLREPQIRERRLQVEESARALDELAKREQVAVLLLSQLNRESTKGDEKRPSLASLKECGALEEIAHKVIAVHRPEMYEHDKERKRELEGRAEILLLKNKNGRTGIVDMFWDGSTATYRQKTQGNRGPNS